MLMWRIHLANIRILRYSSYTGASGLGINPHFLVNMLLIKQETKLYS